MAKEKTETEIVKVKNSQGFQRFYVNPETNEGVYASSEEEALLKLKKQ